MQWSNAACESELGFPGDRPPRPSWPARPRERVPRPPPPPNASAPFSRSHMSDLRARGDRPTRGGDQEREGGRERQSEVFPKEFSRQRESRREGRRRKEEGRKEGRCTRRRRAGLVARLSRRRRATAPFYASTGATPHCTGPTRHIDRPRPACLTARGQSAVEISETGIS